MNRKAQRGAALVETALTMSIFMVLVLGIFEVALLLFDWTRAVEATRIMTRYLSVNDVLVNTDTLSCENQVSGSITFTCNDVECGIALEKALAIAPMLAPENIRVTYQCSSAGYANRPETMPVYVVKTGLEGFTSILRIPSLAGFPATINLPDFETTRTTEDLHTPATE